METELYTYELLEKDCYYLIKMKEDSPVTLIKVAVASDHCLFIQRYDDPMETEWKLKKDTIFDIIECLSDEAVKAWEEQFLGSKNPFFEDDSNDE